MEPINQANPENESQTRPESGTHLHGVLTRGSHDFASVELQRSHSMLEFDRLGDPACSDIPYLHQRDEIS